MVFLGNRFTPQQPRSIATKSLLALGLAVYMQFAFHGNLAAAGPDFAHDIVPILKAHCGKCHTGDKKQGGLSFNTRALLLAGGEGGEVVASGKSAQSRLLELVTSTNEKEQMPPEGARLSAKQIQLLKDWIDAGLPWEEGFTFQ